MHRATSGFEWRLCERAARLLAVFACAACSTSNPDAAADAGLSDGPSSDAVSDGADAAIPDAGGDGAATILTVPLQGCTAGSYLAELTVGGAQRFTAMIDTGSTTLAVAGKGCTSCGVSPVYTPGPSAVDEHQSATSIYGASIDAGGSGWVGAIYEDTVSVGGSAPASAAVKLVAIQQQSDFYYSFDCGSKAYAFQGIVGLAPGPDALPGTNGYFDSLVASGAVRNVFATELCDPGGTLWLGGYDPSHVTAAPEYTPYTTSPNAAAAYVVDLERVEAGGVSTAIPSGPYTDTILDTGNSAFLLPPAAFDAVTKVILASPGFAQAFGAAGADAGVGFFTEEEDVCLPTSLTAAELDAVLPPVTLVFGKGPTVTVTATATEAYLIPAGQGAWCSGLMLLTPDESYPFVVSLGAPILRSSVVVFDRANRRIGFAPHTPCP